MTPRDPARPSASCPTCWPRACDAARPYCRRCVGVDRALARAALLGRLDGLRAELDVLHDDVPADADPLVGALLRQARAALDDAVSYLGRPTDEEEP